MEISKLGVKGTDKHLEHVLIVISAGALEALNYSRTFRACTDSDKCRGIRSIKLFQNI